ncbi:MAG: undecaprenyl-diphosphate phosphatase [Candidatus Shapirobacteria bacterium]|nr:undecaprenyl-diphosphate phosphatase [Candidatus Shapirobacteria bacterium]MDD4410675.1 undecaprenyl-diphosphate phosphatase [Candidatus Shapirobacteria bacterium]
MSLIQTIILSIIQGVAEFLPISSSGHLNLAQYFLRLTPSLTLDIFLNTATFLSVLFFFRNQIKYFFTNLKFIIVASIPAALVGILFKDQIDTLFSNINLLPFFFILSSVFVFSTKFFKSKDSKLDYKKALIIGIFQAVAILPGVSRAGATIFAALLLGFSTTQAFKFSFCLFIPASFGALILSAKDLSTAGLFNTQYLLAFILTFIVGIFTLGILKKVLVSKKFWIFGIYTFILSLVLFFVF